MSVVLTIRYELTFWYCKRYGRPIAKKKIIYSHWWERLKRSCVLYSGKTQTATLTAPLSTWYYMLILVIKKSVEIMGLTCLGLASHPGDNSCSDLFYFISAKCENKHSGCVEWAANGQCLKTPPFMLMNCWKSCSFCGKLDIYLQVTAPAPVTSRPYCLLSQYANNCVTLWLKSMNIYSFQLHASTNIQTNAHFGRSMVNARKIKHSWKKIAGKVVRNVSWPYMSHGCCLYLSLYVCCVLVVIFYLSAYLLFLQLLCL